MPDLHCHFAGDCDHGDIAIAFARKELPALPAPFAKFGLATHAHHRLSSLHQQTTQVSPSAMTYADPLVFVVSTALAPRVKSEVSHQLFRTSKAAHIADNRQQGKGVDLANAQHLHAAQHQRLLAHLLANHAQQTLAPRSLVGDVAEIAGKQHQLQRRPFALIALIENPLLGSLQMQPPAARPDAELVEIPFE